MLIDSISTGLLLDESYISLVASTSSKRYKKFYIKKRNGSDRLILHPSKELKAIQRFIHEFILSKLPIHDAAFGYRENISVKDHALMHKKNNYLARLDINNFFYSIKGSDIFKYFQENGIIIDKSWSDKDTKLMVDLVCKDNALTIGAVTSPKLSNCICYKMDCEIESYSDNNSLIYTRYSDDMYFSTIEENKLFRIQNDISNILKSLDYPSNLWLNRSKTIHTSKKHSRIITGLKLTPQGNVSIGRDKKRKIRSLIHKWESISKDEKLYLSGYLSYCSSVEPIFINNLCKKYDAAILKEIMTYT